MSQDSSFDEVISKGTGWRPEFPSIHDFKFKNLGAKVKASQIPSEIDLFAKLDHPLPDRDQGDQGSCTGHGVSYAVDMLMRMDTDKRATVYSPAFVYWQARKAINEETLDNGAYIRDAVISVMKVGIPPESAMKYKDTVWFKPPTASALKAAERWKLDGSAYRVESFEQLRQALASGYPVVGGVSIYRNFGIASAIRTGVVPMPAGPLDGGHCLCFGKSSDGSRLVTAKGSYSRSWGQGFHHFPYSWFENWGELNDDFWAVTREARPK